MNPLTSEKRSALIELLAERYLDSMSVRDLERFFLDVQTDYLMSYDDEELIGAVEEYTSEQEFNEMFAE